MAQQMMSTAIAPFDGLGINVFNSCAVALMSTASDSFCMSGMEPKVQAHLHCVLELGAVTSRPPEEEGPPANTLREGVGVGAGARAHGDGEEEG